MKWKFDRRNLRFGAMIVYGILLVFTAWNMIGRLRDGAEPVLIWVTWLIMVFINAGLAYTWFLMMTFACKLLKLPDSG